MAEYGGATLEQIASSGPVAAGSEGDREQEIVTTLESYRQEAETNRKSGPNPRDDKWAENLDLYWNRYDFKGKAAWQAREHMPEVPSYVDRFAAAMKEAMLTTPNGFYSVEDPADADKDLAQAVKRMTDVWLSRSGRNQQGSLLSFDTVFEEQMKMGALMACSSVVCWKNDVKSGRVAVETVDPRFVWLDHTYRNLYRVRRIEVDRHELGSMIKMTDSKNNPIFNPTGMGALMSGLSEEARVQRESMAGHGMQVTSTRSPIILDEYIATVVASDGSVVHEKALFVVANQRWLVRGPEPIPYWHGKDNLVYAPLITAPLSVYGRSYMEDFGDIAKTFTELTNLILDAVHTSSMKVWAMAPGMLLNPAQANEGVKPNKVFLLEDGVAPSEFFHALDMGTLSPDSMTMWQTLKRELSETAGMNEIGLGQFAPKGRTSATEIMETQQSSSAIVRSVAQTIETRWLDPTLDLVWQTGLQHLRSDDKVMVNAIGEDMFGALYQNRRELASRPFTFQARGISSLIAKSRALRNLLQVLQIIAGSEMMLSAFMQEVDVGKLLKLLFDLSDVDIYKIKMTEREKMMQSLAGPMQALQRSSAASPKQPGPGLRGEGRAVAASLGVQKEG